MRKIGYILFIFLLVLWACENNNIRHSEAKTGDKVSNIWNNAYKNIDKRYNPNETLLNSQIVENNMNEYIKIEKQIQVLPKEKKQIINNINTINKSLGKELGEKNIQVYWIIAYLEMYKSKIKQLEEINNMMKRTLNISNFSVKEMIQKKLLDKKHKILMEFKSDNIEEKEINALDKFTSLPKKKREQLLNKIRSVSNYIIPVLGWQIVSPKFKQKYVEAEHKIIAIEKSNWTNINYNSPIPYNIVVQYMIKQAIIKSWQCNKLKNNLEKAECNSMKKWY